MQQSHESRRRAALWIERVTWNAAAAAALGVMIWVLLCALQWLDRVAPYDPARSVRTPFEASAPSGVQVDVRAPGVASLDRPSG